MPIDAKFFGTWDLDPEQNKGLEEFGKAMGFNEERIKLYAILNYSFILSQEGEVYKLTVDFKGALANITYEIKEGETIDYVSPDGRKAKLTLTTEDGNPSENYVSTEKEVKWFVKRTVDGDVMTAVTTSGEASMTQVLKRI